jgi:LPXTG-site transpeptidase (sortase) family protein
LLTGASILGLALLAAGPAAEWLPAPAPQAAPASPPAAGALAEPAESGAAAPAEGAPSLESSASDLPPTPASAPATPQPEIGAPLLDERFADNRLGWPDNRQATAWLDAGTYRLSARVPQHFVAVGVPLSMPLRDVVLSATFRKLSGPVGGGYGLILRDQRAELGDGMRQDGRYYVLEVGDRGQIGMWRREDDKWVDLLPWTASAAVRPGQEANVLEAWAIGDRLTLLVNGVEVASQVDATLTSGHVGVFAGGDGNDVALERLLVRTPDAAGAPAAAGAAAPSPEPTPPPALPITRVVIPRTALDAETVPAHLVDRAGGHTWEVPAYKIGHAEGTAGAGAAGNAVLVGHVTSQSLGNVFHDLDQVRVGDRVQVYSSNQRFDYRVVDVRTVGRTDVSVVSPTPAPSLTLMTCTGVWLPVVSDYAERLVVRAELVPPATAARS